jgi:hypothetical protein
VVARGLRHEERSGEESEKYKRSGYADQRSLSVQYGIHANPPLRKGKRLAEPMRVRRAAFRGGLWELRLGITAIK